MYNKIISSHDVVCQVRSGSTIMIGGFGAHGYPKKLITKLLNESSADQLELYLNAPNEYTRPELEQLILSRCKHIKCSYLLHSSGAKKLYNEGKLEILPQGTFAESIRAGGVGIPAYYTSVGIGTEVEKGKETKEIDGEMYLLEKALTGNFAFFRANIVDKNGNCYIKGATKNFSVLMAMACEKVFVEAEQIVEIGEIDPELVSVPGILVDGIIKVGEQA